MPSEIERKFLVKDESYKKGAKRELFRQGYLSADTGRTVRVRLAGGHAFLTIKGARSGISRPEYEYEIPFGDAEAMLDGLCLKPLIEKYRYKVPFGGNTWEVDEFLGGNEGLVVAEIELADEAQAFEKPSWAGEEVTFDNRYANSSLVKNPYRNWKK